jgi:hypothetical protein
VGIDWLGWDDLAVNQHNIVAGSVKSSAELAQYVTL